MPDNESEIEKKKKRNREEIEKKGKKRWENLPDLWNISGKSALLRLPERESNISTSSMSICPKRSSSFRAPAAWSAECRSVRQA